MHGGCAWWVVPIGNAVTIEKELRWMLSIRCVASLGRKKKYGKGRKNTRRCNLHLASGVKDQNNTMLDKFVPHPLLLPPSLARRCFNGSDETTIKRFFFDRRTALGVRLRRREGVMGQLGAFPQRWECRVNCTCTPRSCLDRYSCRLLSSGLFVCGCPFRPLFACLTHRVVCFAYVVALLVMVMCGLQCRLFILGIFCCYLEQYYSTPFNNQQYEIDCLKWAFFLYLRTSQPTFSW